MDGLPHPLHDPLTGAFQRTLKTAIHCVGVGLHSGRKASLALSPAACGTGIVFHRSDLGIDIPARYDAVVDTRLCTVLAAPDAPHARIGTVEHVMAALAACRIDNAIVTVDGPEVPVLDGSAKQFVFLIDCAGVIEQSDPRRVIEVRKAVRVEDGPAFAEIRPSTLDGLAMSVSIAFDAAAIGCQALSLHLNEPLFRREIAGARTFAMAGDIARLQAAGLALGGTLDNALVVDGARVLNPGGLRMKDEFVRHKMLDAVGDLALGCGGWRARLTAHRPGHSLNNRLLRALFADESAWAWAEVPLVSQWTGGALQVAA